MKKTNPQYQKELMRLLTQIKDPDLMREFLVDILSPTEFKELILRLQIIKQLAENKPQRTIAADLGISISKITRGSRELSNPQGGFKKILDKYYNSKLNKDWWQKFS